MAIFLSVNLIHWRFHQRYNLINAVLKISTLQTSFKGLMLSKVCFVFFIKSRIVILITKYLFFTVTNVIILVPCPWELLLERSIFGKARPISCNATSKMVYIKGYYFAVGN